MLTREDIFHNAWEGLRWQGFKRSYEPSNGCLFHCDNGMKSAIGWSVADSAYRLGLDEVGIGFLPIMRVAGIPEEELNFVVELEACHDEATCPEDMEARLRVFADKYHLPIPD